MATDKITCIIVDDEDLVRKRLESLLENFEEVEVIGSYTDPGMSVKDILHLKPDLVFIDVEMPRLNGFDII
mgnify:CR=1 FL=1